MLWADRFILKMDRLPWNEVNKISKYDLRIFEVYFRCGSNTLVVRELITSGIKRFLR